MICPVIPGLPPLAFDPLGGWTGRPVYETTVTAEGTTTLTADSAVVQFFTGTANHTIILPVVSTLSLGFTYEIVNLSIGILTVQSSGLNVITTIYPGNSARFTVVSITGTTSSSWSYLFVGSIYWVSVESYSYSISVRDADGSLSALAFVPGFQSISAAGGTTTLTSFSPEYLIVVGVGPHTIRMPVAGTLRLGRSFRVTNNSTGPLTITSSDGSIIVILAPGDVAWLTLIIAGGTTASSWSYALILFLCCYTDEQVRDTIWNAISAGVRRGLTITYNDPGDSFDFLVDYGDTPDTSCEGDDPRLSDARIPTGPAGGDLTGSYPDPTVALGAITYAKMQDVSTTARFLARKTPGAGVVEECTLTDVLDFVGSASDGDILTRSGGSWVRLPAGDEDDVLTISSGEPSWETAPAGTAGPTGTNSTGGTGSAYTTTSSMADSGLDATLPNAGVYLVTLTAQVSIASSAGGASLQIQLRDDTAGLNYDEWTAASVTVSTTAQILTCSVVEIVIALGPGHVLRMMAKHTGMGTVNGEITKARINFVQLS